jgi:hypothetical protein
MGFDGSMGGEMTCGEKLAVFKNAKRATGQGHHKETIS